ncbi:MAG: alpha/beta hydrolase [Eubacteriales bacterium]|nr:alpha/beta hydrolase [Eubacteriales bacterium]
MRHLVIAEEQYLTQIQNTVEPYLKAHERVLWLERETGRKIYCLNYRADRPRGVVVIAHGFTETAEKYREILYYFVKRGYRVYMPEHCGHGRSYRMTDDPSLVHIDHWQRYVDDLLYVAHRARRESRGLPLYVFGHSMGGGIAAAAAAVEPGLFRKVVLSSPMIRPLTGKVPWRTARRIAAFFCLTGKNQRYVAGQHPYEGKENFEKSSSLSKVRFDYYQEKKKKEPLFQTNAASYGWLYEAAKLNRYLQRTGWRKIQAPVLLFQAEREKLVSKREQEKFARKLARGRKVYLIKVPGSKHEIFNADAGTAERYWRRIFYFLERE